MTVRDRVRDAWRSMIDARRRATLAVSALALAAIGWLLIVSSGARGIAGVLVRYGSIALVVYLAFDLVLHFSRAPAAFDGAGEEFHGPSARAAIVLLVAVVAAVALNWFGTSWALNVASGSGGPLPSGLVLPGAIR